MTFFPISIRACSLLASALLAGAVVATAALPADAVASSRPSAAPADWMHGHNSPPFLRSPESEAPINPADFRESLLSAAVFQETNRQRADWHLPALSPDGKASRAARLHARWMAGSHTLAHEEPSDQGTPTTALDRLVQQGLQPHATAENIAYDLLPDITPGRPFYTRLENGQPVYSYRPGGAPLRARTYADLARVVVAQWMKSPRHRAHILGPELRFLGVGAALAHRQGHPDTVYVAQDFFTPRASPLSFDPGFGAATVLSPPP